MDTLLGGVTLLFPFLIGGSFHHGPQEVISIFVVGAFYGLATAFAVTREHQKLLKQ